MRRKKAITLKMLSESLNLSEYTISKALRGLPGMSEETRMQVHQAARRLGYLTREQKAGLAAEHIPLYPEKPRRFILLLSKESHMTTDTSLMQGIQTRLSEFGHRLETLIIPSSFTGGRKFADWEIQNKLDFCDGIFISNALSEPIERHLLEKPIPKILMNFPPPGVAVDSVIWDVVHATHLSIKYLLELGHREFMYIGDVESYRGFRYRWQAFEADMLRLRASTAPADLLVARLPKHEGRSEHLNRLEKRLAKRQPTACICGMEQDLNDLEAVCVRLGLRIPQDLSVIVLTPSPFIRHTEWTHPLLHIEEAGERAAERMLWRIANPSSPLEEVRIKGGLFPGRSTRSIAISGQTAPEGTIKG
jgi:LacI family transcriptional regulator